MHRRLAHRWRAWGIALVMWWPQLIFAAEPPAVVRAMELAREGAAAAEARDFATSLARLEAAVALRADIPSLVESLAAAQLANERLDEAMITLERLAAMGVGTAIDKAEAFAALRPRADFQALGKKLAANLHPKGKGEIAFVLRDMTGLIEGMAWRRKTGEFFFGDVHGRAVWRRNREGGVTRFTPDGDELLGVFGLVVDEARGVLWAATSAVSAMRGHSAALEGAVALAEIDLATGAVRRTIPLRGRPRASAPSLLRDLALDADGNVFVVDSGASVLWWLPNGAQALELFAEDPEFISLQGIALGRGGAAVLSDRANGLLRVDLTSRQVRRIPHPPEVTLVGLDGLAATPDGQILAIQNGQWPNRVLGLEWDETGEAVLAVTVLESGHHALSAPTLGCLATDGEFHYVGNAGWARFSSSEAQPTPPRSVPVFRTKRVQVKR